MKKLKVIKIKRFFFIKSEVLCKNHPPTGHLKYKGVDFAPSCKSIEANKLP